MKDVIKNLEEKKLFCDEADCFVSGEEFGTGIFFSSENFKYEVLEDICKGCDLLSIFKQEERGNIVLQVKEEMWYVSLKDNNEYKAELRYYVKRNIETSQDIRMEKEKIKEGKNRIERIKKGEFSEGDFDFICWEQREKRKELFPQLEEICLLEFGKRSSESRERMQNITRSLGAFCSAGGKTPFEQLQFEMSREDQAAHGDANDELLSGSFATIVGKKKVLKAFPGDCYSVKEDHPEWRDEFAIGELCPTRLKDLAFSSVEAMLGFRALNDSEDNECYGHSEIFAIGGWKEIEKVILRPFQLYPKEVEKIINFLDDSSVQIEIRTEFNKMWSEKEKLTSEWKFDVENSPIEDLGELREYLEYLSKGKEEEEYNFFNSLIPANCGASLWD